MTGLQLGPLAISIHLALLVLGLIAALIVGALVARGQRLPITDTLLTATLTGLICARLVFVGHYLHEYLSAPWSIIDIRDGGFDIVGGLAGLAVYTGWKLWRQPRIRSALATAVAGGLLVWSMGTGIIGILEAPDLHLPDIALTRLDGPTTPLGRLAGATEKRPLVVNLWASWCPPCRQEMPMLAAAQRHHADVTFAFANQGEAADTIRHFLRSESLSLNNVLLDPNQQLAHEMNAHAFPTTLFFNAQGRLVRRHTGLLSQATLKHALELLTTQSNNDQS